MFLNVILKIAGFLLLSIGVLVLLVILALMLPVRYRLNAYAEERTFRAKAEARWLFGLVSGFLCFDQEQALTGTAKVFGRKVWEYGDSVAEKEMALEKESRGSPPEEERNLLSPLCLQNELNEPVSMETFTEEPQETICSARSDAASRKMPFMKRLKKKVFSFNRNLRESLRHFYQSILQYKAEREKKTEASKRKNAELRTLYEEPDTKRALSILWNAVKRLLLHILPKKGSGFLEFGTGDPYQTAKILEAFAFLFPLYGRIFKITPVFDERTVKAKVEGSGRIIIFYILLIALRCYLSKRVKYAIKRGKEILDENKESGY